MDQHKTEEESIYTSGEEPWEHVIHYCEGRLSYWVYLFFFFFSELGQPFRLCPVWQVEVLVFTVLWKKKHRTVLFYYQTVL